MADNFSAEVVERLSRDLAKEQSTFKQAPGEPKDVYYVKLASGEWDRRTAEQLLSAPELHSVLGLREYLELVKPHADNIQVFYSQDKNSGKIQAQFFDSLDERVRTVFVPLNFSKQFSALYGGGKKLNKKQLVRFLRCEMHGAIEDDVVEQLRVTSFSEIGNESVQHASYSRNIAKNLTTKDGASVPEFLLFKVHVYDIEDVRADKHPRCSVKCLLDIDHEDNKEPMFTLVPVAELFENAIDESLRHLSAILSEQFPTLRGRI